MEIISKYGNIKTNIDTKTIVITTCFKHAQQFYLNFRTRPDLGIAQLKVDTEKDENDPTCAVCIFNLYDDTYEEVANTIYDLAQQDVDKGIASRFMGN